MGCSMRNPGGPVFGGRAISAWILPPGTPPGSQGEWTFQINPKKVEVSKYKKELTKIRAEIKETERGQTIEKTNETIACF